MQLLAELAIKYWANFVFGIFAAQLGLVYRRVLVIRKEASEQQRKSDEQNKAMCEAMKALMRERIFQSCRHHLKDGFVTTGDLEVLDALYASYHTLGGNSIAAELVQRVHKLEIRVEAIY